MNLNTILDPIIYLKNLRKVIDIERRHDALSNHNDSLGVLILGENDEEPKREVLTQTTRVPVFPKLLKNIVDMGCPEGLLMIPSRSVPMQNANMTLTTIRYTVSQPVKHNYGTVS